MKRYTDANTYDNHTPSVVTIGTFDGVHIGHKKIIERLVDAAKRDNLESVILTFFPHPRMVLQKDTSIKLINTIEERIQILEKTGLDSLVIHPFTKEFSRLSAKEYVEEMLINKLNVRHVIIGYDHRFGRNRNSNITDLASFGIQNDFTVEEISKQDIDDVAVSSTKIREALLEGDIIKANKYLGYNFMLTGKIIKGKELGRKLEYPTANLHIEEDYKLIPKKGVYVVKSHINNKMYFGMMNIGNNPTVNGTHQTIETHFFDASFNLYEKKIQIEILIRIRDEKKFDSIEDLKNAMQDDEDFSRDYINSTV
ncbi:bifunctional riboflavin kinase/FAD synthetase [Aquimarina sp. MMG015]|uniref:bifunctional riboflavin kinase/FAD synthetase n=1 Tax=Aquimarina TaxID=290174 RepID=UPI0003F91603|nr:MULTISPECIES: bifunctional riboflavin kinase/FAD synthetase [Aquimarina]AXT57644.1 bifunctional riboflavin kinase/FAD synthetase [Aquimarina sp. AD1]MBQ4805771.1 bifunctional riboflavin kinase/FAD synthetase [Aquimarina sp. MMG015]RKN29023.1 bifunctional riboflavin kinase/FAD synthetase [Aquimarina sp. AD1]